MSTSPVLSPFAMGCQAYHDGVDPNERNPFDPGEPSGEWDEWEDGWPTARLEEFDPWLKEVNAKIGPGVQHIGDFGKYFDDGLSSEEAVEENRVELEKKAILDSTDLND